MRWSLLGVPAVLVILVVTTLFTIVPFGNVAVMQEFGAITDDMRQAGFNGKSPFAKPVLVNIQTQKYEVDAEAASKDLQDVQARVALNYRVDPARASEIMRTLGAGYIEKIAHPAVQEVVKEVTARYNAEDMILRRGEVKDDITKSLATRLAERGIVAEIVNITNFDFSADFTRAIESKVIALQRVIEAENRLRQVEVEARMAKQKAEGEAAARIAAAEGQARSIAIVTDAQVKANNAIEATLSDRVLRYIFVDRMGDQVKVLVVPNDLQFVLPDVASPVPAK